MEVTRGRRPGKLDAAGTLVEPGRTPVPLEQVDPLALLPRFVRDLVHTARRDIAMVGGRLVLGRTPPPLIERPGKGTGSVVSLVGKGPRIARSVKVVNVVHETPDAVSIYLTEQDGTPIAFEPGQFLSLDVDVDGQTLRRAYSLANACLPGTATHITVKRIKEGRVSNHLNEAIRAGMELRVLGPSGNFTVQPHSLRQRRLVMIAGGSGITPIMSILETVLRSEALSEVTLLYGNRGWDDIIFRDRLAELVAEFGARLRVDHVLEEPPTGWEGGAGLLCPEVLGARLDAHKAVDPRTDRYFLCGPTPMMDAAHEVLAQRGVGAHQIAEERYTRPEARHEARGSKKTQAVTIQSRGSAQGVRVGPGQTILEAALAAGMQMPFSCAMGGCGACRVRKHSGRVEMEEPNCLTRSERERGYVLTCVGRPLSQVELEVEPS